MNEIEEVIALPAVTWSKREWQKQMRADFAERHGFSKSANYACGGLRLQVLERDGYKCVKCGMTDAEHRERWGPRRPITVDHKDKDRSHNTMNNLQTLCLICHGQKDLIPRLRVQHVPTHKDRIMELRRSGQSYQKIADATGFSLATIWKWCQRWEAA